MNRAVEAKPMSAMTTPSGMEAVKRNSAQGGRFCDPWGQLRELLSATMRHPAVARNPDARDTMNPLITIVMSCHPVGRGAERSFLICQIKVVNAISASALPQIVAEIEGGHWRNELLGAFVDGDGSLGHFGEDAGFLVLDLHLAEHVAGLKVVVSRLLESVKGETEVIADTLLGVYL